MDGTILFFQGHSWNHDNLKQNGLFEAAKRFDWRVQIIASTDLSAADIRNILRFWKPLGCVFDCGNSTSIPSPETFGQIPIVYLDCRKGLFGTKGSYVYHDSLASTELCARELLSLGFVNFAYVGHYRHLFWSEERKARFREIISAHRLHLKVFAPVQDVSEFEFRKDLEDFLRTLPKPCGLLTVNDEIGEMVLVAANRLGIWIPKEMSVVSIDNNARICESLTPTLSSAEIDFHRAGRLAAELLKRILPKRNRNGESAAFGPIKLIRRASSSAIADRAAAEMCEHIRRNAFVPLRAGEVAALSDGSRRNAEKRFRKATGRSIMEEIHAVRLAKAKDLLANSSYQIAEITGMCGYASESYFRRLFRAKTGMAPLAFRRQGKAGL